jgi:glycosyltransferase involved in cell wall biosynthesis
MHMPLHVVHFTTALSRCAAGVHEALIGLTTETTRTPGVRVSVVGVVLEPRRWGDDLAAWRRAGADVMATDRQSFAAARWFMETAENFDIQGPAVVHAHGIWTGGALAAGRLAARCGCPLVVSPHGMLEPWALNHRRYKKALPWMLWERRTLMNATLLQAMSEQEAEGFAIQGLYNPVAIHGIGLDLANVLPRAAAANGPRTCLFLSRIHPKKGLPMLLQAWALLKPSGWRLVIAGPDEGGHMTALQELSQRLGLTTAVDFVGPVYGNEKWRMLAAADLFVLPSHSENFGIVVAEAMAAGVPVLTTTGTPWRVLREERAGWWVAPTEEAIGGALSEALALSSQEMLSMGQRAAFIARERFNWPAIAGAMRSAYEWAVGGGALPACIRFPSPPPQALVP